MSANKLMWDLLLLFLFIFLFLQFLLQLSGFHWKDTKKNYLSKKVSATTQEFQRKLYSLIWNKIWHLCISKMSDNQIWSQALLATLTIWLKHYFF